jgi:hypothetical protein
VTGGHPKLKTQKSVSKIVERVFVFLRRIMIHVRHMMIVKAEVANVAVTIVATQNILML